MTTAIQHTKILTARSSKGIQQEIDRYTKVGWRLAGPASLETFGGSAKQWTATVVWGPPVPDFDPTAARIASLEERVAGLEARLNGS